MPSCRDSSAKAGLHPSFVLGELAMGNLRDWHRAVQSPERTASIGGREGAGFPGTGAADGLAGSGIGFVDAHLLAAVAISPGAKLWTRDKRLAALAERLDLRWEAV
jgi:predicted nucleic acid-binding protein